MTSGTGLVVGVQQELFYSLFQQELFYYLLLFNKNYFIHFLIQQELRQKKLLVFPIQLLRWPPPEIHSIKSYQLEIRW